MPADGQKSLRRDLALLLRPVARTAAGYASVALGAMDLTGDDALCGPLYAQVSIADPCNHRCVMCPYHPPGRSNAALLPRFGGASPGMMTLDRFRSVVGDLARLGTRRVDLVGRGEPLLNREVVPMVAFARAAGLDVALTTNGSLLDAETVAGLAGAGLDRIKISLNAGSPATYAKIHVTEQPEDHGAVLEGVRRVTRRGCIHTTLSFTISTLNLGELEEMVERGVECGAHAVYFQHLVPVPEQPELSLSAAELASLARELAPRARVRALAAGLDSNLSSFAREAQELAGGGGGAVPCYVGYYFAVVLGNGKVMPCCQVERPIGDLATSTFDEVWRGEDYRRFRRAARRLPVRGPELETAECERCYFRPHNVSVHRVARPLSAVRRELGFSLAQALRMDRGDED